jgi:mRNA interferase MazF
MVKRRPAIVISPQIARRAGLCTIVPMSTTPPEVVMPYHCKIEINPVLPFPWDAKEHWVKADMVFAASLTRLDLIQIPRQRGEERKYRIDTLPDNDLKRIRECILRSLGLAHLTKHI